MDGEECKMENHSLDLPLMSNTDTVHVNHYILDLHVQWEKRQLSGSIFIFCEPSKESVRKCSLCQCHGEEKRCKNDLATCTSTKGLNNYDVEKSLSGRKRHHEECDDDNKVGKHAYYEHSYCKYEHFSDCRGTSVTDHSGSSLECSSKALHTNNHCCKCEVQKSDGIPDTIFKMVLDSWNLHVDSVKELALVMSPTKNVPEQQKEMQEQLKSMNSKEAFFALKQAVKEPLEFKSEKTCIRFWKGGVNCLKNFPTLIQICYSTSPDGPSLKWTKDQDGSPCVYTHGHWINNRSLFPSQDAPDAMATWQAYIHCASHLTVLMSGDDNEVVTTPDLNMCCSNTEGPRNKDMDCSTFYYRAGHVMPSSTLALAVGHWTKVDIDLSNRMCGTLPSRLYVPQALIGQGKELLVPYLPRCLQAASEVLGNHPFSRQDLLIVPSSFSSLGMASPNLMFLAQSVLSTDGEMLIRVAHEVSHAWFGLSIGPLDWHEEWLSEGFATFVEGFIHTRASQVSDEQFQAERQILDLLKYNTLAAELETVDKDLQLLRHTSSSTDDITQSEGTKYIKNGMNPEKSFLQLHYLKGYFLLRHLENLCGTAKFLDFIKYYAEMYKGQLVSSLTFLAAYKARFPDILVSIDGLMNKWLDSTDSKMIVPPDVSDNISARIVDQLAAQLLCFNDTYRKTHWRRRIHVDLEFQLKSFDKLSNVQTLLLLERLLGMSTLHPHFLHIVNKLYNLSTSNPDVLHRWCELVIKHNAEDHLQDVASFLVNHQAMGVYLFGELMLTKRKKLQTLARDCFTQIKEDLEEGVFKTIHSMLYGY